jgi:hypothetical protein
MAWELCALIGLLLLVFCHVVWIVSCDVLSRMVVLPAWLVPKRSPLMASLRCIAWFVVVFVDGIPVCCGNWLDEGVVTLENKLEIQS